METTESSYAWVDKSDWHLLNNVFAALLYDMENWRSGRSEMQDEIKNHYQQLLKDRLNVAGLDLDHPSINIVLLDVAKKIPLENLTKLNVTAETVANNVLALINALSEGTFDTNKSQDLLIKHYNFWVNAWFELARLPRKQRKS